MMAIVKSAAEPGDSTWLRLADIARRYLIASVWVYFTFLGLWIIGHLLTGDRYVPLALITVLGPYLFLPLLVVVPFAILSQRRDLLAGCAVGAVVFLAFWGTRVLPSSPAEQSGPALTVMTYNVLGTQDRIEPALSTLRRVDADVVFLQEVTPRLALGLERGLADRYPYQVLRPEDGVTGMGVISRYPLRPTEDHLPLNWVGKPQILRLSWQDESLVLVHFHSWAFGLATWEVLEHNFRLREAQAFVLANYAREAAYEGPVIAAGDLNAVDRSDAYRYVTQVLEDAWLEGGRGFGHTFPGSAVAGSSRPQLLGVAVPQWMARIDYVFHSRHLAASRAWLAPFDGVSDHRPVVARLVRVR